MPRPAGEPGRRVDPVEALSETVDLAVIGGGPAGLAAAEAAAARLGSKARIVVFDAKPSLGRKLLMAGKSGLNITNAAPAERMEAAYRDAAPALLDAVRAFPPAAIRDWMAGLGQESFVGSSGRVFPTAMKASPLLRAWLSQLRALGVETRTRWRWTGFSGDELVFETGDGGRHLAVRTVVLACGGASWPRLGADGRWTTALAETGATVEPFQPSNVGWEVRWSAHMAGRFAGAPLKPVALLAAGRRRVGELTVTRYGLEGGPLYAATPELLAGAPASIDLAPDRPREALSAALAKPRGKQSVATWLRKAARLDPVKTALLREGAPALAALDPHQLAQRIKACPVALSGPRPIAEAISTAGGLAWAGISDQLELTARPGVFVAGEMLAWDAPTGGYLLTACLALGRRAGRSAADRLADHLART